MSSHIFFSSDSPKIYILGSFVILNWKYALSVKHLILYLPFETEKVHEGVKCWMWL